MNTAFRDRSLALAVVGGLELLAGLGIVALTVIGAVAVMASPEAQAQLGDQPVSQLLGSLVANVLVGIALGALGGGLLACRRWARAISLVVAWGAVAMGAFGALTYAVLGPTLFRSLQDPALDAMPIGLLVGVSIAAMLGIFVLPGALGAWILGSEDARLTCEWRDRHPRWTDGAPTPVLALTIALAYAAITLVPLAFLYPAFVAGRVLSGAPAAAFYLAMSAVMAALAVGIHRRRTWAWSSALALFALGLVNAVMLFRGDALAAFYRAMRAPPQQVEMITKVMSSPALLIVMAAASLAMLLWLLAIRKHFAAAPAA